MLYETVKNLLSGLIAARVNDFKATVFSAAFDNKSVAESDFEMRRHEVRPGITGWAQVHGRNALTWADKFRYDVEYVDRHNLWMDFKILLMTIPAAFAGGDEMEEFKG